MRADPNWLLSIDFFRSSNTNGTQRRRQTATVLRWQTGIGTGHHGPTIRKNRTEMLNARKTGSIWYSFNRAHLLGSDKYELPSNVDSRALIKLQLCGVQLFKCVGKLNNNDKAEGDTGAVEKNICSLTVYSLVRSEASKDRIARLCFVR